MVGISLDTACLGTEDCLDVDKISEEVPVIDMAAFDGPDYEKTVKEIARACETWGFFQLINHGISESLLDRTREVTRGFFRLPQEEKSEYSVKPGVVNGWYTRTLVVGSNKLTHSVDHLYYVAWPTSMKRLDLWPRNPPDYRIVVTEYAREMRSLAERVLSLLSEMLGLERRTLQERLAGGSSGEAMQSMRINHYTPSKDNDSDVGLDAHSDPGGLTLLLQDDVAGLQVKKNDQWVAVELIHNAFVVNIGDQIEMLSNGRYKSVEHRGMAHSTKERLSVATFYSPTYDVPIGPVQQLVSDAHPPLYRTIKYGDYFSTFVKQGLKGKDYVRAATV